MKPLQNHWVIVGCRYVGSHVDTLLRRGASVQRNFCVVVKLWEDTTGVLTHEADDIRRSGVEFPRQSSVFRSSLCRVGTISPWLPVGNTS